MHNIEATDCTIDVFCHNVQPEPCIDCINKTSYNTSLNWIPFQTGQMVRCQAGPVWGGFTVSALKVKNHCKSKVPLCELRYTMSRTVVHLVTFSDKNLHSSKALNYDSTVKFRY
ncbi:hypothetical protein ACF0H5_015220 [Mactra antiquata]